MPAKYDWNAIKTEYITTDISYRALGKKHNIPYTTISHQGKIEKWVEARDRHNAAIVSKSVKKAESVVVDYASELYALAYKTAKQLNDLVNTYTLSDLASVGIKPRDVTGAIKDLKEVLDVRSDRDVREQEARIANLRRQADEGNASENKIQILIEGEALDYTK